MRQAHRSVLPGRRATPAQQTIKRRPTATIVGNGHRPGWGPLDGRPKYRQVADQLRAAIATGHLAAGDRLPTETDLTAVFGVSRVTVRAALAILRRQGLITTRRGTGSRVQATDTPPETGGVPAEVAAERDQLNAIWGQVSYRSMVLALPALADTAREAAEWDRPTLRADLVRLAAVAVATVEALDRHCARRRGVAS